MERIVRYIRGKYTNKLQNNIVILLMFSFVIFMYMPMLDLLPNTPAVDEFYTKLYVYFLSPFGLLPYIVGFMSLFVQILSRNFIIKAIFIIMYILTILVSLVASFGMQHYYELIIFLSPDMLVLILHLLAYRAILIVNRDKFEANEQKELNDLKK